MKLVHKIDGNGFYIEDIIIENEKETPLDCIDAPFINGFYKPKFVDGVWTEGISEDELKNIEESKNKPQPKSELESLKEKLAIQEQTILELSTMIGGNK